MNDFISDPVNNIAYQGGLGDWWLIDLAIPVTEISKREPTAPHNEVNPK